MAYSFSEGVALNTGDLLVKLRNYVQNTVGWTIVQDTVTTGANGQYFTVSSVGEGGQEKIVLRFHRQAVNVITVYSYLSWAAGVGQKQAGSTSATAGTGTYIQADDNGYIQYWFFGSLDRIVALTRAGMRAGLTDTMYAGLYQRQRAATFRTTGGALAAGNNVVIALADTSIFSVGKRYMIADDTNFENPVVTNIVNNVSITVDTLQFPYVTGARIGEDVRPTLVLTQTTGFGLGVGNHYLQAPPLRGGLLTQGGFVMRTVDQAMIERTSPDGEVGSLLFNLWPIYVCDESHLGGAVLGQMIETFITAREGIATDDDVVIGGATYRVVTTAPPITATSTAAIAAAIRRL